MLVCGVFQKVRDDRRGHHVDVLRARVVAHQQAREFVIAHHRHRVAAFAILQRRGEVISQQRSVVDRVARNFHRGHQRVGDEQRAGRFELPDGNAIADRRIGDFERLDAIEKTGVIRFQQRQIRFVVHHFDTRRNALAGCVIDHDDIAREQLRHAG